MIKNIRLLVASFVVFNVVLLLLIYYSYTASSTTSRPTCVEIPHKFISPQSDEDYLRTHKKDIINVPHHYGYRVNVFDQIWNGPWWKKKLPIWENNTFLYFHTFIRETTSYVGMGEWIGPTLLFAAKRAHKLVGAEPDPYAYAELRRNVEANPSISHKITLSKLCISNKAEVINMYGAGGSGSFLSKVDGIGHEEYKEKHPTLHWMVYCIPLWAFCDNYEAVANDMFIKLDTEGAEQYIVPSLYPWLSNFTNTTSFPYKPAFFISLHDTSVFSPDALDRMTDVIRLYKWVSIVGETIEFQKGKDFPRHLLDDFPWADLYLTDRNPKEYGIDM